MSDGIKELLDDMKDMNNYSNFIDSQYGGKNYYYLLEKKESKQLLDYITNLQEENKELSMIFDTFSKRPYAHKYLEEKKKELGNKNIIGLDSEMIYKDYYDCKSRIDKALRKLRASVNHFNSKNDNNVIRNTIRILEKNNQEE